MSKAKLSIKYTSRNDINKQTSKKTKSQDKKDFTESKRDNIKKYISFENKIEEEIRSKSCYKSPYN